MYMCNLHTHACNVCCNHPGRNVYTHTYIVCTCIMSILWAAVVSRTWRESKQLSQSKTGISTPSYPTRSVHSHYVSNSLPISKQNTHKPNTCTVHNSSIGLSIELHNTQFPPYIQWATICACGVRQSRYINSQGGCIGETTHQTYRGV